MADFDERSGIVACTTPWGLWYQTLDEVSVEVNVDNDIKSKDVVVEGDISSLSLSVAGQQLIKGTLFSTVKPEGMIWTLETTKEHKVLRIVLQKQDTEAFNTWHSLLTDDYVADQWLLENMRKKAALEKMQLENPGFDLSGADITGHYATGGPEARS